MTMSSKESKEMYQETTTPMLGAVPAKKWMQIAAVSSISMGTFCAGTVLCWTSPALSHIELSPNMTEASVKETSPGFTVTASEGALIASMLNIGALVAAIPVGYCADKIGRKLTVIGLAVAFLINWLMISFSNNFPMVVVARFLAGIGLGGICVVAPIYIGEIAEASKRGFFSSFLQLFLAGGVFITGLVGSYTSWMGLSLILALFPILLGVSFAFMPESPVYLVSRNKLRLAEKNLKRLRGSIYNISEEMSSIEQNLLQAKKANATFAEFFTNRGNMKALIAAVGILMFQQFSGINAIVFYTINIFKAAGTDMSPFLASIIMNFVQWTASIIPMLVIERGNRKLFLTISSLGMMVCLTGLGIFFHLKLIMENTQSLGFIPLASTVFFMIFFCVGYGPIPWMLLGELFSPEIKGFAGGISILVNWASAFVVTFSFPLINEAYGAHVAFYILGLIMGVATVFVYFVVPETRGKTLNEIQDELNR